MNRILTISIAALLLLSCLASCGTADTVKTSASESENAAGSENAESSIDSTETQPEYTYPSANYEGKAFRVYNIAELWDMYVDLDQPELTGEALDDAVYERNRRVEDKLGCVIDEFEFENEDLTAYIKGATSSILAGEDSYEVIYLPISQNITPVTDGYLLNLTDIPELNLGESWWDQDVITASTFGDKLYFATNAMHLMSYDGAWCLFFNENMVSDHGLDQPYDLVRDGKWTLDALDTYLSAAASLNGDESFAWKDGNNCVYGMSCHLTAVVDRMIYSCGERYVSSGTDGLYVSADNPRFYSVVDKINSVLDQKTGKGLKAGYDFDVSTGGYMYVFESGRAMFLSTEIKGAQLLRNMEDTLGMLPFPKYDESQEDYQSTVVSAVFFYTIPVTCSDVSFSATVSDALCYESYKTVIPVYYDITVSQKGLRNEDSIEMLEIIRAKRGIDISTILGWSTSLYGDITNAVFSGDSQVASIVAKYSPTIEENIAKFNEFIVG